MTNVNGKSDMIPTESETTSTVGNFSHGSRETPATSSSPMELDRSEKARCQHPDMHVAGESDSFIVPEEEQRCQEPFIDKKGKFCWKLEMGRPKRAAIDWLIYHVLKRNIEGQAFLLRTVGCVSRSTSGSGSTRRDAALEF